MSEMANDQCWQAVLKGNTGYDGRLLYGVTSTGIYCRPSCPAKRPKREHVVFYSSADAAEQAGFRACLRCRPEESNHASATGRRL